jgi:iron complex outermembrane receptor protein
MKAMKSTSLVCSASILALLATPAFAANEPAKAAEPVIGDIIVTATRNETLLSKTPIALTAVSGDTLRSTGITNPTNLGDQVPSLTISRNNGIQITIRGVSSADGTEKGDPSAAFMVDGVYIARPQAFETSFYDINRVEVLRGPQGTLFGRNSTAGIVNIITNRPNFDRVSGAVNVSYGNYNNSQVNMMFNAPLNDSFAIRAAVNYDRRDSFLRNGDNLSTQLSPFKDNVSGRLSALWRFDKGELLLRGYYNSLGGVTTNVVPTKNFYSGFTTNTVNPVYIADGLTSDALRTLAAPSADGIPFVTAAPNLKRNNKVYGGDINFKYDLGPVTLDYIGSYSEFKRHEGNFQYNAFGLSPNKFDGSYEQNSQELRLSGTFGALEAQVGAYYFHEHGSIDFFIYNRYSVPRGRRFNPGELGYVFGFPQHFVAQTSYAGFGQLVYSITPSLRITAGARITHDRKQRIGSTSTCKVDLSCMSVGDSQTVNNADVSYSKTTWKAGIDYDLNDTTLVYGSVSTGYKAGGFNDGCERGTAVGCSLAASALYYQPETLTSYEVGVKTRLFDNMLRLNLSAFHYNYSNLQLTQVGSFCPDALNVLQVCAVTRNATEAKVDGVELESTLTPTSADRIDFSISYLNARYGTFFPNTVLFPALNWKDLPLDRSPKTSLTAGYTHTFDLGNSGNVEAGVRTKITSSYVISALAIYGFFTQPSFTNTQASLTYNEPDKRWYVQGYINNIENKIVVTTAVAGANGTVQFADPLTFGVRAGLKF